MEEELPKHTGKHVLGQNSMCKGREAGKSVCVQGRDEWALDGRLSLAGERGWVWVFDRKS